ncbi:P-loop NTPase fold protein [Alcanivorax sp. 1008]|uniref:P-loop NTPase fold protein n=1 Tax=Alcanivorax sp. 1008 TaxID=2816853 RepID=UPI001DEFD263|nr:P-loop NTPase fold protein [Alcanivorax sp. 1008]MCC1498190.1 hypothetical protein [Alcanivorax sp. 1008]
MSSYTFEILHERVSDNDDFEDKTHEKVASNIHRIIESSTPAITIGLEGGWGSGKSTVVNLLTNKLSESQGRTLVYLFDAWAHDGDPLRRIFLEGLIAKIDPEEADTFLQKIRQEISGRKKTVEVKTKKSASKLGGFLSLSAIFVPFGAALLSAIDYSTVHWFSASREIHWPFIFGSFFALSPLWVLCMWGVFSDDDPKKAGKKFFLKKKWDVFESSSEESYTQDITEDGERTSIEFEHFFGRIMNHVIGERKKYHRALIVVDNLDRIEPQQTLSIWSILQTFFQYRSHGNSYSEGWKEHLWFLVPYDREGLSRVWGGNNESNDSEESNYGVANSFLEKCFQLVEEVPEPVLSSWAEYCEICVNRALADWPDDVRRAVTDTYKSHESSLSRSPTPRQIQSFVNKVGLLGMRWGDAVSGEAMALYALARGKRSERQMRAELLSTGLPDGYRSNDPSNLKAELCGLLFGVDKNKGIQLLLDPEIAKALGDGDADGIADLASRHGEAFWIAWHAIRERLLPKGHVEEYRIAVTTALCNGLKNHVNRAQHDVDHLVAEWESREEKWELGEHHYIEAIEALSSALGERRRDFIAWLNGRVKKELFACIQKIGKEQLSIVALKEIRALLDFLQKEGLPLEKAQYDSLNKDNWISWLGALKSGSIAFPEVLPNKAAIPSMIESIDPVNAGDEIVNKVILTMKIYGQNSYCKEIAMKLYEWLLNPERSLGKDAPYALLIMCQSHLGDDLDSKIKEVFADQNFIQRSDQENIEKTPSLLALYAIMHNSKLLEATLPAKIKAFFESEPNHGFMEEVINIMDDGNSLSAIWHMARSSENKFAIAAIRHSNNHKLFCIDTGAIYFDEYDWATDSDLEYICAKLVSNDVFPLVKKIYIEHPESYFSCMKILISHGGDEGRTIVNDILPSVSAESWEASLKNGVKLFDLLDGKGNHEFKDAVASFAIADIAKTEVSPDFWNNLSNIYKKLPDKEDVIEIIARKYFCLEIDPFDDSNFNEFGKVVSSSTLSKIPASQIMARVELWLRKDAWKKLEWLLSQNFPLAKASESLTSRLNAAKDDDDGENPEIVDKLASLYGVEIGKAGPDPDAKPD